MKDVKPRQEGRQTLSKRAAAGAAGAATPFRAGWLSPSESRASTGAEAAAGPAGAWASSQVVPSASFLTGVHVRACACVGVPC